MGGKTFEKRWRQIAAYGAGAAQLVELENSKHIFITRDRASSDRRRFPPEEGLPVRELFPFARGLEIASYPLRSPELQRLVRRGLAESSLISICVPATRR